MENIYFSNKHDLLSARNEIKIAYKEIHLVKSDYEKKKIYCLYNDIFQEEYNSKRTAGIQKVSEKILNNWLELSSKALSNFPGNVKLHIKHLYALVDDQYRSCQPYDCPEI